MLGSHVKILRAMLLPDNRVRSTNPISDRPFAVEINFTEAYQAHHDAHPAIREARCLQAMFPDALSPIEEGDRFAGRFIATPGVDKVHYHWDARRHNIPALGFLPLCPGSGPAAGYFCHEGILRKKIEDLQPDADTRARLEGILAFWETETIFDKTRAAYPEKLSRALPFDQWEGKENSHPAHPLTRMAGPHYDNDKLLHLGLPGLRAEIHQCKKDLPPGGEPELLEGMLIALDVLEEVCRFYALQAIELAGRVEDEAQQEHLREMATALQAIIERRPEHLLEAMQLVLLFGVVSGAYSWGRMDEYFGDYLVRDLDRGYLSEADALALIKSWWIIVNDNGAPFDNRVIIGGRGRRNEPAANRFARLAIEATAQLNIPLPQLSLRFYEGQDPALYNKALQVLALGKTFPILYNDDVNIPAVASAMGVSRELAEQYVPYGCGEYVIYKKSFGTPSGIFNHTKILECVLRNGEDRVSGRVSGIPMGNLRDFKTFDELLRAYQRNLEYWIETMAEQQRIEYEIVACESRFVFWSMLYDDCLARGRGMFNGGLEHLGGTLESYGQINAADSLYAIKQLVYEDKVVDADTLIAAMDAGFAGYENLQRRCRSVPKYGNDEDGADTMQQIVHEHCCRHTRAQAGRQGMDSYLIVIINNCVNTVLGHQTLSSADGRAPFSPLANANNPSPGMDRKGVTAFLNSLVKLRPDIHAGATQNMKFSPQLFGEHYDKLKCLLKAYWRAGAQAMITTVNPGDLEAAMERPEDYPNLLVRVGGFSARFVELPRDVQMEILNRTCNT